jgi:two-component system, chemotaxis family, protein-glutamate methylesterase/glutaminase
VDHQVSIGQLTPLWVQLIQETAPEPQQQSLQEIEQIKKEIAIAAQLNVFDMGALHLGVSSPLTCPECHGSLESIKEGNRTRFRCHTGHAYSSSTLLTEVTKKVEESL